MKTETRSNIVRLIREGGLRPIELVKKLKISPQAIHRHLKSLALGGFLEIRGRGPKTRYFIAGEPDFERARRWHAARGLPTENPRELICETRDVFAARLARLGALAKEGLNAEETALTISVVGEIGNNCFDHNIGSWREVPGCWFETQRSGRRLWICIADRGQGVFRSLSRADSSIQDEQTALFAAFDRKISGRKQENRGNGLKFVRNIMVQGDRRGISCRSGSALVEYGALGLECRENLSHFSKAGGTITLIVWSLK